MHWPSLALTPFVVLLWLAGCSEPNPGNPDSSVLADVGSRSDTGLLAFDASPGEGDSGPSMKDGGPSTNDAGPAANDAGPTSRDGGRPDGSEVDAGPGDERGFHVRKPVMRTIPCQANTGCTTEELPDHDHVCTLVHGTLDGFLYVQATPVEERGFAGGPRYETAGAWVSVGGVATFVSATYDSGGNHRNDWITFEYQGQSYKTYHSSFGWGWRVCQPMDCLQLLSGETVTEDGCTKDRTLPIVCVDVADDGTIPPLVDHFAKCPGDPNG
ncbi:MAG: hypothetical protein QM765_23250 [Myxococcales bacterium]